MTTLTQTTPEQWLAERRQEADEYGYRMTVINRAGLLRVSFWNGERYHYSRTYKGKRVVSHGAGLLWLAAVLAIMSIVVMPLAPASGVGGIVISAAILIYESNLFLVEYRQGKGHEECTRRCRSVRAVVGPR